MKLMNGMYTNSVPNTSHVLEGVITLQTEGSTQTKFRYRQELL